MNKHKINVKNTEVPYAVDAHSDELSRYGGIPAFKQSWQAIQGNAILQQAHIHYGQGVDKVADLSFLLLSAPFVNATSQRKVTQRFGGEGSGPEVDPLLAQQTEVAISQRTLNRFVTNPRYEWLKVQRCRVQQIQQLPGYRQTAKGWLLWMIGRWSKPLRRRCLTYHPFGTTTSSAVCRVTRLSICITTIPADKAIHSACTPG